MEKKAYVKPSLESETFVPSAYCNVCYQVACEVWLGKPYHENYGWDPYHPHDMDYVHRKDHCGSSENQLIEVDGGRVVSMKEVGTDGLGELDCNILSPLNFKPGMPVDWTTTAGGRTWTHHGVVQAVSERNPGMS